MLQDLQGGDDSSCTGAAGSHYLLQVELDEGPALQRLLDTGASPSVLKTAAIARTP